MTIPARTTDPATATAEDIARAIPRKMLLGDTFRDACVSVVAPVLAARDAALARERGRAEALSRLLREFTPDQP